ncbi:DUF2135 domain-containing protein [Lysobacter sp. K5869]|nr:DUF2135 domain-containing protein [Lysobacter sp. K5869]
MLLAGKADSPVRLESARIDAELSGGLAHTAIELVFRNPGDRVLEGALQFPLRDGQQIDGFALDIDGAMRPAVPVPKAKGRAVFEDIKRRGVDPGLLEQTAGNQFKLRVYPIPAHGTRRVRLELRETLRRIDGRWRFELPLAFAAPARDFALRLRSADKPRVEGLAGGARIDARGGGHVLSLSRAPAGGALALSVPAAAAARSYVQDYAGERYFLAEVPVSGATAPRALPKSIGLLWDSSGSARKRDIGSELALLDRYFRRAGEVDVSLIRLRDRAEPARAFRVAGGDWSALRRELESTVYDGASAPGGWIPQAGVGEYLLFGDGLFNYGTEEFPKLAAGQRLYALDSAGAASDGARLRALAQANGGRLVSWRRAGELDRAAAELLDEGPRLLGVDALGADQAVAQSPFPDDGLLRIAGRLRDGKAELTLRLRDGGGERSERVAIDAVPAGAAASPFAARMWARYSIAALEAEPELNRAAIARLGQRFGVVTAETSLIVLEEMQDYVRYGIEPPGQSDEYRRLKAEEQAEREQARKDSLDEVVASYRQRIDWWQRDWPKGAMPLPKAERAQRERREATTLDSVALPVAAPAAASAPAPAPAEPMAEAQPQLDAISVTGSRIPPEYRQASIALQPWQPDSPYARRLRAAPAAQVYRLYLDERDSHAASTAFYLDVADVLEEKGQRELALRVLSNLAELDLENRHVLRVLGYRLLQAGQAELAVSVFERVLRMAEEEPQSFRDLGLAQAAAGRYQLAVDHLYEVAVRNWDGRFPGIEEIAVAELNAIAAAHPQQTDLSAVDPRLRRNLPVGLRAVLSWDSDDSDMDLWVTDPNGEKCYYGNRLTYQGGRITDDFTGGYGPEEFALRKPKPGKYKIEANFYGEHQQLVTGATTVHLWLSTGFGAAGQQDRQVTLRLRDAKDTVLVGEFEVK